MTQSAAALKVRLFGTPEVAVNGRILPLKNQKAHALLFYLASTRQAHTRSHLANLLWSEYPASNASGSLRATLFQLRKALRTVHLEQIIVTDGERLHLQIPQQACDVSHFCALLEDGSESALMKAIDLYRGSLLADFTLPDTPVFDEWVRQESEKLQQAYLHALKRLADHTAVSQNWQQSITYLQRLVQTDPLREDAQQQLMRTYLQTGAVSYALRQYQHFENELHQEMGITPAPATRALFQDALQQQQAQTVHATAVNPTLITPEQMTLPFVGRDRLLNRLSVISHDVKAGHGSTVLLQGDSGIGKTRLLQEFLMILTRERPSWLLLQGACSPFDDLISFGPFLEAFQTSALGDLSDQLLSPKSNVLADREQFTYRILQMMRRLSQNTPVILAIDDLQWANRSTLNLFGLLATRLHHLPLLLIGTVQRPETIPALQRLVTMERRRGHLDLLSLPPLPETAVTQLLHNLAVTPTAVPALAHWLQERADGNPFVLDEIIAQLRAEEILTSVGEQLWLDNGRWLRWRATYTLPKTTHDLVSWRLHNLSSEAYALLELLAVAGQPLPSALLADISHASDTQLLPTLDELLSRGLIVESDHETYGLSHYLLRETMLQRLSHMRRRLIHRQLAQKLASCPAIRADLPSWEIARHAVAGEDVALARQYGLQILAKLPRDYTGAVTVDFLLHLYDLLTPSATPDEMLRLTRAIADVQQSLGHLPEAAQWQQQYLQLAQQTGDVAAQIAAHLEQGELALISNDYLIATQAAQAGLALCASLPETNAAYNRLSGRGHRLLGHALAMEGSDLRSAERHLQTATAVHRQGDNLRDLCACLFELGNVAAQRGKLHAALDFYAEAAQVAEAGQAHYFHALACNNLAYHNLLLGRLDAAQRALAEGQKLAEVHELLGALLHLSSTQVEVHLYLAEWEAAEEACQSGLALAEELGNPERQAGYRAGLALAARGQRDFDGAITLLEEALLLINGHGYWHLRTRLLIWLAETALLLERFDQARQHLAAAMETAQTHNRALLQLQVERLEAQLLAIAGNWLEAELCFTQLVEKAASLDLSLEVARTQAVWGETAVKHAPPHIQSQPLLTQALQTFIACQAHADRLALQSFLEPTA